MESMLKSESYSSVPLALTSGFTSEADKLKAGQTREGIQKLNWTLEWARRTSFIVEIWRYGHVTNYLIVMWWVTRLGGVNQWCNNQVIWLVSDYIIVMWHVTRQGALTYDVRMSFSNWLVFWGVYILLITWLRTVHDKWSHYTIIEIACTFCFNLLLALFLSLIWVRRENEFAFLILLLGFLSFMLLWV